ncbi:cation transport protein-domain-containing protein [Radiomyces spectabilis]|uniref:cation transport protein-domain-containing protein n=1 Tax=Radiomyces spectabilis TaxID=64574 RepID=UPI00221F5122|nr:cation transport protein-domain-containing protein [Radiomyces spectabilis]KAI8393748.1 cation transport protein-domain-containing protein [Radiomyces spectabilis]
MTGDSDALQRVTTPTSLTGTTQFTEAHTVSGTQGIAFAENIKQQREEARRRLEKDRRFEELLQKIADESHTHDADHRFSTDTTSADGDDIMRQPVDKSQLTREQRYRIGGAEYRAIDFLTSLVPTYYFGFMILSAFFVRIYIAASSYAQDVLRTSNPTPSDPWFFSFFLSISAFNNLGLSLLDASMAPFQNAPFPLIISIILILVGNTAFAILLRFIIWCLWKLTPASRSMRRETFRFLLDHPRRCYTTLFPSTQTWWLLIILIAITLVELICFLALNYWLPVLKGITWGSRFLDGLFQSVATRNAGFSVVSLMDLNPGTQLVYIVAMYISVYPVAISMRNSNVYQERALGIFRGDDEDPMRFTEQELSGPAPFIKLRRHPTINSVMTTSKKVLRGPDFFVVTQIQRQLTSDICWVIVGIFLICVLESEAIMSPSPVTIATVIYECVSAFGNVGASTGYPNTVVSQAGQYRTLSKLVLILLMYRLPAAIDRAVLLPSEQLEEREAEDSMLRRRNTSFTQGSSMPNVIFYNRSSTL